MITPTPPTPPPPIKANVQLTLIENLQPFICHTLSQSTLDKDHFSQLLNVLP